MTFVASVAAGIEAVESLRRSGCLVGADDGPSLVCHQNLAVAWAPGCPWVTTHDDGDVLVVLDGRVHNLGGGVAEPAERLLSRYRDLGTGVARGLLGEFVLIVLDRRRRSLLVARDPVGVRPWYLAETGRRLAGASDMASLARLPWVDTAVNEEIAIEHLAAMTRSLGDTVYRGIGTLRPGTTWVVVKGRSRTLAHHQWKLEPQLSVSWDEGVDRCRQLLDAAVACRLPSTCPAASEVSGGLDSSAVVGTAVRLGRSDLVVGRLTFDGQRADERSFSDAVVRHWGVPVVSSAPWIPTEDEAWDLTRELRRPPPDPHFTMFRSLYLDLLGADRPESLTGLGGDDAFAACRIGARVVSAVQLRQRRVLLDVVRSALRDRRQAWVGLLRPTLHHLAPWRGERLPPWVSADAVARAGLSQAFRQPAATVTGIDAIDERIANITSGYNAAVLEDRAIVTDGAGRRDSHPYLDPRLIEGTYGFDPWWPVRDDHTRALQVAAYVDRLPPAVAERRSKVEFSEVFWPQTLTDGASSSILSGPLTQLGWLDPDGFTALEANARRGVASAAIPLSRCVKLDRWLRAL